MKFPGHTNVFSRLLAIFLILCVTACIPPIEEESPKSPAKAVAESAASAPFPQAKPQDAPPPPAPPAPQPPEKKDDFAPATNIKQDEAPKPDAATAPFAPATRIGEEITTNVAKIKVALLIPMSGDSTALGKSLLDAAVLAVYDKYTTLAAREITA